MRGYITRKITTRSTVTEDVVRSLGFLPLGTRMKRIGEHFHADAQRIMEELGVPLQASQYPFLASLDRLGPLTIGALAEAVGVTQPGATRAVGQLARLGMVTVRRPPEDQRRRVIALTAAGRRQVDYARKVVWPRIEAAVADLCATLSGPLLHQLDAIEDGLAERPLYRRPATPKRKRR
jgi:DNA-binding MarR family transcriptional regulator